VILIIRQENSLFSSQGMSLYIPALFMSISAQGSLEPPFGSPQFQFPKYSAPPSEVLQLLTELYGPTNSMPE
jgi:hypothetical protein